MPTSPFSDIERPICEEFVEIGQPTFTELISVRQKTTKPAIGTAIPNTLIALKEVAFGRSCRGETQDPFTPGMLIASPLAVPVSSEPIVAQAEAVEGVSTEVVSISKYSINNRNSTKTYIDKVSSLGMARSSVEFRKLVINDENIVRHSIFVDPVSSCVRCDGSDNKLLAPGLRTQADVNIWASTGFIARACGESSTEFGGSFLLTNKNQCVVMLEPRYEGISEISQEIRNLTPGHKITFSITVRAIRGAVGTPLFVSISDLSQFDAQQVVAIGNIIRSPNETESSRIECVSGIVPDQGAVIVSVTRGPWHDPVDADRGPFEVFINDTSLCVEPQFSAPALPTCRFGTELTFDDFTETSGRWTQGIASNDPVVINRCSGNCGYARIDQTGNTIASKFFSGADFDFVGPGTFEISYDVLAVVGSFTLQLVQGASEKSSQRIQNVSAPGRYFLSIAVDADSPDIDVIFDNVVFSGEDPVDRSDVVATITNILTCFKSDATIACVSPIFQSSFNDLNGWTIGTGGNCSGSPPPEILNAIHIAEIAPESDFTSGTGNRVHLQTQQLTDIGYTCLFPSEISIPIILPPSGLHKVLVEFRYSNNITTNNSFEFGFKDLDDNVITSAILTNIDNGSLPNLKLLAEEFEIDTQINPNVLLFFKIADTAADFELTMSNVSVCLNTTVELCTGTLINDSDFDTDTGGWGAFSCPFEGTFAIVTQFNTFLKVQRGDGSFLIPGIEKCPDDGRVATRAVLTQDFFGFEEGYILVFFAGGSGQTASGSGGANGHIFEIVITDDSGNILARSGYVGGNLEFGDSIPAPLRLGFSIPTNGIIISSIDIRPNPAISNLTEYAYHFDRILSCGTVGATVFDCPPGSSKLSFDAFVVTVAEPEVRTAWIGGTDPQFDSENQWMILFANRGTSGSQIQRIYSDLNPFSIIFLEFDIITLDTNDPPIPPTIKVGVSTGVTTSEFEIEPGRVGIEINLGDRDTLLITIQNVSDVDGAIDNILVCERPGSPTLNCLQNVTDLSATVRWNGIPRAPINLFNALIRYTLRDINDSSSRTDVTFLPTSEGRLGIDSCDRWKQELVVLDNNILSKSLSLIDSINEGDIVTVGNIGGGGGGDVFTSTHALTLSIQQGAGEPWESVVLDPLTGETSLKVTLRPTPIVAPTAGFVTQVSRELLHLFDFSGLPSGGVVTNITFEVTYDTTNKLHGDNSETIFETAQIVVDRLTTLASGVNGAYPGWLVRTNEMNLQKFWGARTFDELGNLSLDAVGRTEEPTFTTPLTTDQLKATDGFGFSKFAVATRYSDVFTDKSIPPIPVLASGPIINFETTVTIRDVTATVMYQAAPKPGRTNWLWSIPTIEVAGQDDLVINFPNPPLGQLVESVNILLLANQMIPTIGKNSEPVNPAPLACTPDPAQEFDVLINYTTSLKLLREFAVPVQKNILWSQEADFIADLIPWDTVSASEHGLKGETARWEQIEFLLDTIDGRGLDQCSIPITFVAEGISEFSFKKFAFDSTGVSNDACDAEIIIEDLSMGAVTNEIQSIVLPTTTGGTWDLSFTNAGTTETTTLPWNTTAPQIRVRLGAFTNIGGTNNVDVTGLGSVDSPFLVEFIDNLAAKDLQLLVANGNNLTGASAAFVSTENDGTNNERQRISNPLDNRQDLTITFGGSTSIPIPYNSSLSTVQSAIEGITGIGAGNVSITGDITDRDAAYTGPYIVDFIGALANSNVAAMIAAPTDYVVTTDWNGGSAGGQNEKQLINVNAFGGTYTLRVFNVDSSNPPVIVVTTIQNGGLISNLDCYDIEFAGTLAGTNIDSNTFFFPPLPVGSGSIIHTQQNIRIGAAGTVPITEIQRHCFQWVEGATGFLSSSQFGLTAPSDTIFDDILDTVAGDLFQRGINNASVIKAYLESAIGVTAGDIIVSDGVALASAFSGFTSDAQTENFPTTDPNPAWQNVSELNDPSTSSSPNDLDTPCHIDLSPGEVSDWLEAFDFLGDDTSPLSIQFDEIPDGSVITRIQMQSGTRHIQDEDELEFTFQLMKDGVRVGLPGINIVNPVNAPPPPEVWNLGQTPVFPGGDELFGETWTKEDLISSGFGIAFRFRNIGVTETRLAVLFLHATVKIEAPITPPEDEIQTVALKNGPTGGTFTLTVEGETTAFIPHDASATAVQNALRSLPNLSSVVVTETGILPADVTYTVFFQDADGGKNWQTIVADARDLESDSDFADTAPIVFNAAPSAVESALIAAASFITDTDISVTQVIVNVDDGLYVWRAEFIGAFARQDVIQMQANASALNGAPVVVTSVEDGGGTNDRQRITIFNATSGSFRLSVTIDEIEYTTTPIPWDTTAAGMEAQLLALAPFDPEDLTVTELPKSEANQQLRVTVTFKKKFGNIPLMIADFEDTLLCDPASLEFVPIGPYGYPIPDHCDIEDKLASACQTDLSCQSGPLLSRPCEGDEEPDPDSPCCDADNIPISANCSTRLHFERDLFDPSSMTSPGCLPVLPCTRDPNIPLPVGRRFTIRDLAVIKGLDPSDYVPYFRNFNTQQFIAASYSTPITTKMNIILIENELDTNRGHQRIVDHLQGHREILPARFVWPDCDTTILGSEECWPGIS